VAGKDLRAAPLGDYQVVVHARNVSSAALAGLAAWTPTSQLDGEVLTFSVRSRDALPEVMRHLVASGADVYSCTPERVSLEELFVSIMGEDPGL
jgi:hypothetical protein